MEDVYAFLADGFEEVEAIAVVDILLRAGLKVKLISITDNLCVTGAHGIQIHAQNSLNKLEDTHAKLIFLPGGMPGTTNLEQNEQLKNLISIMNQENRYIAAICAAPKILGSMGILSGKKATCYPGFEEDLLGAEIVAGKVVVDGNIITSRGMGTAIDMGLKLVEILADEKTAKKIAKSIQYE